jgi:hypothetical protein
VIDVLSDPTGDTYRAILNLAMDECETFSLVWLDQLRFLPSAEEIAGRLTPHLIAEVRAVEWPGTRLLGPTARLRRYRISEVSMAVLAERASLFSWRAPDFPEDLAFYNADGSVWLGATAHEEDAFFDNIRHTKRDLMSLVPGLHVRERHLRGRR